MGINIHRFRWRRQKYEAKKRNIEWNLTFEQWWDIWQQSGFYHLRGSSRGEYCMSRYQDQGAYEVGNVYINLHTNNISDANKWSEQPNTCRECIVFGVHYDSITKAANATKISGRRLRRMFDAGNPNVIFK